MQIYLLLHSSKKKIKDLYYYFVKGRTFMFYITLIQHFICFISKWTINKTALWHHTHLIYLTIQYTSHSTEEIQSIFTTLQMMDTSTKSLMVDSSRRSLTNHLIQHFISVSTSTQQMASTSSTSLTTADNSISILLHCLRSWVKTQRGSKILNQTFDLWSNVAKQLSEEQSSWAKQLSEGSFLLLQSKKWVKS